MSSVLVYVGTQESASIHTDTGVSSASKTMPEVEEREPDQERLACDREESHRLLGLEVLRYVRGEHGLMVKMCENWGRYEGQRGREIHQLFETLHEEK